MIVAAGVVTLTVLLTRNRHAHTTTGTTAVATH